VADINRYDSARLCDAEIGAIKSTAHRHALCNMSQVSETN
jgi:hypothetical protein